MRRWVKVLLVGLVALVVLLVLNAIAVTKETKDAERNVEGAELVETSSGTLQALEEGDPEGSPIVLLHGATESMNWFEELGPLLAGGHRVIRLDLLGHGGSDKPGAGYEVADQASAVAEALAKLDVSGATVVGNSLGASVATALAEQSPDLVTGIVVLDQAPDDGYSELPLTAELPYWPILGPTLARLSDVAPDSVILDEYQRAFAPGFNIASGFENPDQPVEDLREMTYTAFVDIDEADIDYTDARRLDDRLSAIEVPVLVVFGAEDQIYDAPAAIEPYEDIEGVQTELMEGVGHTPNVEAPERTAALIEAFIARTEATERAARRAEAAKQARKRAARRAARAKARQAAKARKAERARKAEKAKQADKPEQAETPEQAEKPEKQG